MASEGLGNDQHGVGGDTAEDCWTNYVPKLLGFDPNSCGERSISMMFVDYLRL